ncbi:MAG: helix-turn-helix transcriptional regulator [Bacteroidaceae bacterium]|nr:helix-turn-helix transcriptional regulator [Bacteroidaceae bacterium]
MKDRIASIMTQKGLTPTQFADMIGIQRSTLSHILNGRNKASTDIVYKIHDKMPDISINWLLFGEGEMYINKSHYSQPSIFDEIVMNSPIGHADNEYRKEMNSKEDKKDEKTSDDEETNSQKNIEIRYKKITKIMVFYSDNTFDTFSSDMYK